MLEKVKRDPAVFIQGDDLAVKKRILRKPFAGAGYLRELSCKEIFFSRPERYFLWNPCRQDTGSRRI